MDKLVGRLSERVQAVVDEVVVSDSESEGEAVRLSDPLRRKQRDAQRKKRRAGDMAPEMLESGRIATQSEKAAGTVMQERKAKKRRENRICGKCDESGHDRRNCPLLADERAALKEKTRLEGSSRPGSRRSKGALVGQMGTQVSYSSFQFNQPTWTDDLACCSDPI
jgi:hypothetical protein